MQIGIPAESRPGETRVAATPRTVQTLVGLGYDVVIEAGAGHRSSYLDLAYAESGAVVSTPEQAWSSDVVLKVNAPADDEIGLLRPGAAVASLIAPALNPDLLTRLSERGVTVLAMDAVPRISRAQALDVLSSMANIAGYRAVVEAAHEFGSLFTGQVTAAGKVPPAKVLVVGAGVAGLAAIGTAVSLGAIVRAFDARPEVAEQVRSMGAEFLEVDVDMGGPSADGYAKTTSEEFDAAASRLYAEQARDVDIVITTALIPGRPAPRLLTASMIAAMKPGSVIVDMAAANGGNCEGAVADQKVVTAGGVTIIGYTDLAARLPTQASQLFGTNLANLVKLMTPGKDGQLVVDFDDVVVRGLTVVRSGEVTWPPPPVQVSAAPAPVAAPAPAAVREKRPVPPVIRLGGVVAAAGLFLWAVAASPPAFLAHLTVFVLACVVGFYVVFNVHHALHTPLMSVTNAISGIIVVGALLQIGQGNAVVTVLSFVAILVASINIFGGFTVTRRMLTMFRRA